ncbi:leucine-rich repeat domain-containing protein [Asanoa sp. WMMD1127]|uniref:leucine-rich repeat domain-containing protein n=1 Tax=Asanoa sp. WMMD1127 TaxID=3016107 RepID=UPI0024175BFE|nr:leucine-rich repeat domain-containing protein [Asanoa sp. WMMD1127]MDG4821751.1 leucine-rich repeat domain-containing protein [Asanoa sp. WMMD1127]
MDDQRDPTPRLLPNRFAADAAGRSPVRAAERCFHQPNARVRFHGERQDTSSAGWRRLLELIDEAAADGRDVFRPLVDLTPSERADLVTLPPTIAKLTRVRHFVLYGSPLVRIPPEIGAMTSLEVFEPYTSYSLHWFPYELTRCPNLRSSTVSTRALYGNFKYRPPFPRLQPAGALAAQPAHDGLDPQLWSVEAIRGCSVCDGQVDPATFQQLWISLRVATDVLPLLVNACSTTCAEALPKPADGYIPHPHQGGRAVPQPQPDW